MRFMKYNQASYKHSHNSCDRDEDSHETLAFHPNDPGKAGCRGLEYDIWRHSDGSNGRALRLNYDREASRQHPGG